MSGGAGGSGGMRDKATTGKPRPVCILCNKGFHTERGIMSHGCCDRGERTEYDDACATVREILDNWRLQKEQIEARAQTQPDNTPARVVINGVVYERVRDVLGMREEGEAQGPPLRSPQRDFLTGPSRDTRGLHTPSPPASPTHDAPPVLTPHRPGETEMAHLEEEEMPGRGALTPHTPGFRTSTTRGIIEFFEVPYSLSFWSCLNYRLIEMNVLVDFCPSELSNSMCHSPNYPNRDAGGFMVHPTQSQKVLEFVACSFGLLINVFVCSSIGAGRRLVDIVGEIGSQRILDVCYVSDECELQGEGVHVVRWPSRSRQARPAPPPPPAPRSPSPPLPTNAQRWLLITNSQEFLHLHVCKHGCGTVFKTHWNCSLHEKQSCVRREGDTQALCKLTYSTKPCLPRLDLAERLEKYGLSVEPESIFVESLAVYDLETSVCRGGREATTHRLFSGITTWSVDGELMESRMEWRANFLDDYSMVSAIVGTWVEVALRQKAHMEKKTAGLRRNLGRELAWRQRESPNGYFTRRLARLIADLRQRSGTLVTAGFNSSKYDVPILVASGLLHFLRSLFPSVSLVKKDSAYVAICAWNEEEGIGIRLLDLLLFHSPTSLKSYIESHKAQLTDFELDSKGEFPYNAIDKTMDSSGQDSGYVFSYDDFHCPVKGRNTLNEEWEVWCHLVREWEGDREKALKAGKWKEPPEPGPTVFANLQRQWDSRGLSTALRVLEDYMRRDTFPLLRLTQIKVLLILQLTGKSLLHDFVSISSFVYNWLLSHGRSGAEPVTFYGMGPRLTRMLRAHTHGGLSWVSNRLCIAGMKIPPLRLGVPDEAEKARTRGAPLGYAHQHNSAEHNEEGILTEDSAILRVLDANAMYASAIGGPDMLHGKPICRQKSNAYAGLLCDDKRSSNSAQILAFLSEFMQETPVELQSEFTSGESYVVIDAEEHGEEIEKLWNETIGLYKVHEREWKVREKKARAGEAEFAEGVRVQGLDLGEEEEEEWMEVEEGDEEMADFIVEGEEKSEPMDTGPARRRIYSDSESDSSPTPPPSLPPPPPPPSRRREKKAGKPPPSPRFKRKQRQYRYRVDGLLPNPNYSLGVDAISELYSRALNLEEGGIPPPRSPKGLIIEVQTCLANHAMCSCSECPNRARFEREPDLFFTTKYFSRSFGLMIAEDAFRLGVLRLDYELMEVWSCEWERLRADKKTAVAAFCASFVLPGGPSSFPLDKTFTEGAILSAILDGRMSGLILADFYIPEEQRLRWASCPPIIKKRLVTVDDMESPFKEYAIFNGYNRKGIEYLTSQFTGTQILITTHYAKALVEMADARISQITEVIELKRTGKLKGFVDTCVNLRRQADREGNPSQAALAKLSVNAGFGYSLIQKSRYTRTMLGTDADYKEALISSRFYSGIEVGRPGADLHSLVEISKRPFRAAENTPVILGFTVLNTAKVALLRIMFQMTYFLRPGSWAITGGDTDSVGCFLSNTNMDEMVRKERMAEWLLKKWEIFVNPEDPDSFRTPGLWKVETSGTELIHLSSKLYSILNNDTGSHKVAARGASLGNNRILLSHAAFYQALERPLKFAKYLEREGLVVTGHRALRPMETESEDEEEEAVGLDWPALCRVLDGGGVRRMERAYAEAARKWEREEERQRLASLHTPDYLLNREDPLTIANITFKRNKHNFIRTITTNRTILLALFAKRKCIGDGTRTVPLPEPPFPRLQE